MTEESLELKRCPEPPVEMNEIAAGFWRKKVQHLKAMGKLKSSILESLQAYCNHLSDMQKAREMMDKSWGMETFQKYQKIYIEANKQQIVLAKEFGFTPLSGIKVPPEKAEKEEDFDDLNKPRK